MSISKDIINLRGIFVVFLLLFRYYFYRLCSTIDKYNNYKIDIKIKIKKF